ncbi:MAG: type II toxin-antitoxin system VapC family toxin [bacterium]
MYVTDTHPLAFYTGDQTSKLSKKALKIFEECEQGNLVIYIPAAVLWVYSTLVRAGKIKIKSVNFETWCQRFFKNPTFLFQTLEIDHIMRAHQLNFHNDPFDVLIVATAKILDMPLITKDRIITDAHVVDVVW